MNNNPPPPSATSDIPASPAPSRLLEDLLKRPNLLLEAWQQGRSRSTIPTLVVLALLGLAAYGIMVGSFSGESQWIAAPAKIALGTLFSAVICLPSLYIFICLSGGNTSLATICGTLTAMLCTIALLLVGFLPVAWIFSQSTSSLAFMGFLHLAIWIISVLIGFRLITQLGNVLGIQRKNTLRAWAMIFLLVTLQMSTALRPLLGTAGTFFPQEKKFFVAHWADCINQSGNLNRQ